MALTLRSNHLARSSGKVGGTAHIGCLLGLLATTGATGCIDRPVGETRPETHNVFLNKVRLTRVDKIDVLFMVDNSLSMADKQQVLAVAVPQLLRRLTSPDCVSSADETAAPIPMDDPTAECENAGYHREFSPVKDIHIGVVTSSLGDFGGNACNSAAASDGSIEPSQEFTLARNDQAWLLGSLPRTKNTLTSPFLAWTPEDANDFANRIGTKEAEFRSFVTAAAEHGCGYEMSLESWYRFLVDPEPPKGVDRVAYPDKTAATVRGELDQNLIAQRKQFLRPDSLLAIVILTDENDCSFKDEGRAFLMMTNKALRGGSSVCQESPNDPCCYSCDVEDPPSGCMADPACSVANPPLDVTNLRCFDQKKRYGHDFLFPTSRYVNALRLPTICPYQNHGTLDCECKDAEGNRIADCVPGQSFKNPLFDPEYTSMQPGVEGRSGPDMVFLAGIVGVPWQDIAEVGTEQPNTDLRYKLSSQIDWDLILPSADGTPARDPLMHEQMEPRTGTHPITQEPIGLPTQPSQRQLNHINWHDWAGTMEVQYACVFDLSQPLSDAPQTGDLIGATRDCEIPCADGDALCENARIGCPCEKNGDGNYPESPLCQASDGRYGKIQYAAKAYPGTRHLEVLRGHDTSSADNSIVASICPKDLNWDHRRSRGYGYNPAVQALVDRLKTKLTATCLPRQLVPEEGKLPCAVVEAIPPSASEWANCETKGRDRVDQSLAAAVINGIMADQLCDAPNQPSCSEFALCQLRQLTNDMHPIQPLTRCQSEVGFENGSPVPGFCYVDPSQGMGTESVVEACPTNRKRMLRIVGDGDQKRAPAPGAWTFIACAGAPYRDLDAANAPAESAETTGK